MRIVILFVLAPIFLFAQNLHSYSEELLLMGSSFTLTAVHEDSILAQNSVKSGIKEIQRIEALISSWQTNSQTSAINKYAGIQPVVVDAELYSLIERSLKFSKLSNGYFDISFASIDKIWFFDGGEQNMPDKALLQSSVAKINYQNIILDKEAQTVFLKEEGMKIGFGAIGKGYAADKAKSLMQSMGIQNGVVNAGGDLLAWGAKENGKLWTVGIADPNEKNKLISSISLTNQAVVTSGDYERFVLVDGKRYGHIINPKTGMPVQGVLSVTIIAPTAEMADALATTVFVLGEEEGLKLVNHLKGVACIIINAENKLLYSEGISLNNLYEQKN